MKEMELWLVEPRGNRYYPVAYDDMFRTGGIQEKEWYMIERGWNCACDGLRFACAWGGASTAGMGPRDLSLIQRHGSNSPAANRQTIEGRSTVNVLRLVVCPAAACGQNACSFLRMLCQ